MPASVLQGAAQEGRPTGGTRLATASLVLGIVAIVCNLLLIPTILAIVFGAIGLGRRTAARGRAIAGIVLGAIGVVALCVEAAIAIPVFLALQHAAVAHVVEARLADDAANHGTALTAVDCPVPSAVSAGSTFSCTATESTGGRLRYDVVMADGGQFTYRTVRVG